MGLGCYNPFPFELGGEERPIETVHRALNESYGRVLDVSDGTLADIESYAEASLLAMAWDANERVSNQFQPLKMMEALPKWEDACGLKPLETDPPMERRAELAAKFRGFAGNAEPDIRDVCVAMIGAQNFVELSYVASSEDVTYWSGENPGPPGIEWFSKKAIVFVEVTKAGLTQDDFDRRVGKLASALDDLLPSWQTFEIFTHETDGTDEGFFLDFSSLDEVGL